jgi:hypothetical protein
VPDILGLVGGFALVVSPSLGPFHSRPLLDPAVEKCGTRGAGGKRAGGADYVVILVMRQPEATATPIRNCTPELE